MTIGTGNKKILYILLNICAWHLMLFIDSNYLLSD
jgi:hypothetical protein